MPSSIVRVVYVGGFDACVCEGIEFTRDTPVDVGASVAERLLINPEFQPAAKTAAGDAKEA